MRMLVITEQGRFVGAQQLCAPRKLEGHLDARLVAGPGQRCQELEVPDDVVPRNCADGQAVAAFADWMRAHVECRDSSA